MRRLGIAPDFVFLDTEHVPLDRCDLAGLCTVFGSAGIPPLVRIATCSGELATAAVDAGAAAVVAPYIEEIQQVVDLVGAVKYRPLKGKLLAERLQQASRGAPPDDSLQDYLEEHNAGRSVLVNIESTPAIEHLGICCGFPGWMRS